MHKCLLRTLLTARSSSHSLYELCVLSGGCGAATAFSRAANGSVKTVSTCSATLCKLNDSAPSQGDGTSNAEKEAEPTETSAFVEQKSDDGKTFVRMEAADGSITQQNDVTLAKGVDKAKQVKTDAVQSGKKSLLELLGTMKVDVTSKKKDKKLGKTLIFQSTPKSVSADMGSTTNMFQKAQVEASPQSKTLDPELVAAASAAASTLPNRIQAESELLRQLRKQKDITETQKKGQMKDLGVLIADMKVGKKSARVKSVAMNQIQFDDEEYGHTATREGTSQLGFMERRKNLFPKKGLNIFPPVTDEETVDSAIARPTLWDMDFAHQLSQSVSQMPRNRLEEMIEWTKEGKLWQYPVNNEAGLEEEATVPFHEHVFLEKHLEEGFPDQGPVRHFMELVLVGLSKNPYLTVQQKKEHIFWFREYFQQKEDLLNEAEAELT